MGSSGDSFNVYKGQKIAIVVPCQRRDPGLEKTLNLIPAFVDEVIIVDSSRDGCTSQLALPRRARIVREQGGGCGNSYRRGFSVARGDIIITLDGDHSYPVEAISYLLEAFLHLDVDFLSASRFPVRDLKAMSLKHRVGNMALSLVASALFVRWLRDSQSVMWVFRREILSDMNLESDGITFFVEMKIEALTSAGVRFRETPIQYSSRLGEANVRPWRDGIHILRFLLKKRFTRRRGKLRALVPSAVSRQSQEP